MPRATRKILKRYTEGIEILDSDLEMSFLWGYGVLGTDIALRTLEDWRFHWDRWRDVVMPKAIEHRPGLRPFACYVCGELPERPVLIEPPLSNGYFKLYVPATKGNGTWHYRYPEPYQRSEASHLFELGVIDKAELKRYRAWKRTAGTTLNGAPYGDYPYEQGSYA